MRTSEQTTTLIAALVTARAAFQPVMKDALGQVGKDRPYKYADLSSILDAVMPALLANNLVILQSTDAETHCLITRVTHTSGEWVESIYPLGQAQTPQAFGSALTYGRRYSIQSLLCLAAADDDGAAPTKAATKTTGPAPRLITAPQRKKLVETGQRAGWTHEQMRRYLIVHGISGTDAINTGQYDDILDVFGTPFEPDNADPDGASA